MIDVRGAKLMDAETLRNLQREEDMKKDLEITSSGRRDFLKGVVLGTAAVGAATRSARNAAFLR